jgi:hypothetical protein
VNIKLLERRARYAQAHGMPVYVAAAEWPALWAAYCSAVPELRVLPPPVQPTPGTLLFGVHVEVSDAIALDQDNEAALWIPPMPLGD